MILGSAELCQLQHQRETSSRSCGCARSGSGIGKDLDQQGNAMIEQLLSPEECRAIAGLYPNDDLFRSRVVMGRHGFGRGEYKYFSYPLPDLLSELRTAVYPHLVPIANRWNEAMGIDVRYPGSMPTSSSVAISAGQAQTDAASASIWSRRLQLPAPGPLRRACLPAPVGYSAV